MSNVTVSFKTYLFPQDPCYRGKCKHGAVCHPVSNTTARCVCSVCHFRYKPVCGSDNRSYLNHCFLRRQACLAQSPISMVHHGRCSKSHIMLLQWKKEDSQAMSFLLKRFPSFLLKFILRIAWLSLGGCGIKSRSDPMVEGFVPQPNPSYMLLNSQPVFLISIVFC